jgi:hypothetical protein
MLMSKPILCLDFDGVIHSYSSGWKGADVIPDPPVLGAIEFIARALERFSIAIYSSRSGQPGGIYAMRKWLRKHWLEMGLPGDRETEIEWPTEKPAAFITIDDRALTFDGTWPDLDTLLAFKPWNKREFGATGQFPQGQLNDDDQGGLRMGVAYDKLDGIVRVEFGKPVAWLGLPPPHAIEMAKLLLKHAGAKKIEIEM